MHRNEVTLVGRLSKPPRGRELPSGDRMTLWGVAVRRPPEHPSGKKADGIACVTFDPEVGARVAGWRVDDVISVEGALHQRFWGGPTGGASTYEVEVYRAWRLEPGRRSLLNEQGRGRAADQPEHAPEPLDDTPEHQPPKAPEPPGEPPDDLPAPRPLPPPERPARPRDSLDGPSAPRPSLSPEKPGQAGGSLDVPPGSRPLQAAGQAEPQIPRVGGRRPIRPAGEGSVQADTPDGRPSEPVLEAI
ncbi:single-stranded DNA-binding protein [Sphaerisporangium corydalis]|uniref:Single-stranded DNA-binding protein n=1 Tax=Sphaerisporangium corydalis TaxID=1441875 RepID=A0ABV9EU96_9ACTN|nr:single-stranded DNA-binding protein [Sphaerisporangium corydalis]